MFVSKRHVRRNLIVAYLGGEVEPQIAVVLHAILDKQGHLARQAELNGVGQAASLAEVLEVLQGEGEGNGLSQVDRNVLLGLFYVADLPELNGS
jgi:hypothetical protein